MEVVNSDAPRPARAGPPWLVPALVVVGVIILATGIARRAPLDLWVPALRTWVESRGTVGMVGFGVAYAVSALLFVPGAALTLVAGGVFGLGWGMVVVSIASSVADGAAFLIGRYLARDAVERLARRYHRFQALDTAITQGGWRVVALLRLSPTVPYSASNYFYGLTGIRFLPYWITTWAFTLPGTFAYVYLGYVGAETLGTARRTALEWSVLVLGLTATVTVTVYLAVLARRSLRRLREVGSADSSWSDRPTV